MDNNNQIIIYQTDDDQTQIDVRLENETVWLTQAQMADLFQKDRTVISRHIRNVFKEGELDESLVCANLHTWVTMANNATQRSTTILMSSWLASITKCKLNKRELYTC